MQGSTQNSIRSKQMSAIKSKNSKPELLLRHKIHALGYRYLIHDKRLPGTPDMVFPKYKAVILVNGCFWHGHDCHIFKWPKTRKEFWLSKITNNQRRDQQNIRKLNQHGWKVMIVWECALVGKSKRPLEEVAHAAINWIQFDSQNAEIKGQ